MAKCKECKGSFGLLELKNGTCKSCINKKTPPCAKCGKNFDEKELSDGYCAPCLKKVLDRKAQEAEDRKRHEKSRELEALSENELQDIVLTTETSPDLEIEERIEIITAECAFGMNIFKDLFAGVRDIVGGRSKATQGVLRDARKTVLSELRKEAYSIGANAVIAVDLDYNEFSGGGKSMLFVVASGTAVKVKKI
ncbi:YbjQ family protein [Agaribacterium sp. ZY112]|uniref:YbjQ family protein n=1 Tax=Agaribacterium sp. ZY112 TaxID=3233574 RepID=UPI0035247EF7